jgi:foldase protein PrsA
MRPVQKRIASLLVICIILTACQKNTESNPKEVAFTVNGEEIGLREWNFYIRMNQMQWEKGYLETYGDKMWSEELDEEGTTLADSLKEEVFDTILQIHLTNQHAEEYQIALDEEDREELHTRAADFMKGYHQALLDYAQADEAFVYEKLCERELSRLTAEAAVQDFVPEISEEEVHREGICYVLISTTGLRDSEGNLTPFSEEEVEARTLLAQEVCEEAKTKGDLETVAEEKELTPILSSMGEAEDGQEPLMLEAAKALAVGEVSEPIWTEEGWFIVQHTSDYDEEGTSYFREYLSDIAREEEYTRIYETWKTKAKIVENTEIMEKVEVEIVLKELL